MLNSCPGVLSGAVFFVLNVLEVRTEKKTSRRDAKGQRRRMSLFAPLRLCENLPIKKFFYELKTAYFYLRTSNLGL